MTEIRDISDKGRKPSKRLKYEVGVYYSDRDMEDGTGLDVVAKFKAYGDAVAYANQILNGSFWFAGILIRS